MKLAVALVLVLVALVAPGAAPAAAPKTHSFDILAASSSYSVIASRGCVSGHRDFSATLNGAVPTDPGNVFAGTPGDFGSVTTRNSETDVSPTTGSFSNDYIDNSCSVPPCHFVYPESPIDGPSISMDFQTIDPDTIKVSTGFGPPGVGDVTNGICGGPIDVRLPFGEPSTTVSADQLFSGKPVPITISGSMHFDEDNLHRPSDVTVNYTVSMTVQSSSSGIKADPGGPYKVRRAGKVKLDGSKSTPRPKIERYKWKLKPIGGACPEDIPLKATKKEGRKISVVPLCGVRATLTVVAKNGDRDTQSTDITVLPRGPKPWRTPFSHREKTGDSRTPRDPPSVTTVDGGYAFSLFGGLNVSDCGRNTGSSEILCPPIDNGNSWLGSGYELAKVNDPNGPFDDYSYVSSSSIDVKRAALINPSILPNSTFYRHNVAAGLDAAGFLAAIRAHEGLGNGTAGTGHSGIMKEILATPTGDPRRVAETLFGPNRDAARKRVDKALHAIEKRLDKESDDPLGEIWNGSIDFYNDYTQQWITGFGFRIPGPMRG